jgi:hypothetical protein
MQSRLAKVSKRVLRAGFPTKCDFQKQEALAQNLSPAEQRMNTRISESAAATVWWS